MPIRNRPALSGVEEGVKSRQLLIACLTLIPTLAVLALETARGMLEPPPMPREMKCVLERTCPIVDPIPVAPLIAPRQRTTRR